VGSASQDADGFVEDRIEIHEIGRAALESLREGPERWDANGLACPLRRQQRWYQSRRAEGSSS
jgi:hypothetical protein